MILSCTSPGAVCCDGSHYSAQECVVLSRKVECVGDTGCTLGVTPRCGEQKGIETCYVEQHAPYTGCPLVNEKMECVVAPTVYALVFRLCAEDHYTDGGKVTTCNWDRDEPRWVYATASLCNTAGKHGMSLGDWRTIDHDRLYAVDYKCDALLVQQKDLDHGTD